MNYLVFVLVCVLIIIPLAWAIEYFHKKKVKLSVFSESHKKAAKWENLCCVAVFVVFVFMFSSPAIYEFKPCFSDTQYKMIRDNSGKIVSLEKNATGFHWPFCSGDKFVCLSDEMRSLVDDIKYTIAGFDSYVQEIKCTASCEMYPKAFIASNGLFAHGGQFLFTGETRICFMDWVYKDFYKTLRNSLIEQKEKGHPVILQTPTDVYNFASEEAKWWNVNNPYGCKIEVKQP